MNPINKEVGGNHYMQYPVQPIEIIAHCNMNFFQGNIIKYALRHKFKNGVEDLKKAIHYCELGDSLDKGFRFRLSKRKHWSYICDVAESDNLSTSLYMLLYAADNRDYKECRAILYYIMNEEYKTKNNEKEIK